MTLRIFLCAALVGFATPARAQDDQAFISYRHNLMESIGHDMAAIGDVLKHGLPLQKNIGGHAQSIATRTALIAAAFERKAMGAPNDAKPEIWTDWKGFETAIANMQREADALASAASAGDPAKVGAGVQALGKACNGCHETYRKPKEESYKRRVAEH
jgi:cytochrome c556